MVALIPILIESEPEERGWVSFSPPPAAALIPIIIESEPEERGWVTFDSSPANARLLPINVEGEPEERGWVTYANPDLPVPVFPSDIPIPLDSVFFVYLTSAGPTNAPPPPPFDDLPIPVFPDSFPRALEAEASPFVFTAPEPTVQADLPTPVYPEGFALVGLDANFNTEAPFVTVPDFVAPVYPESFPPPPHPIELLTSIAGVPVFQLIVVLDGGDTGADGGAPYLSFGLLPIVLEGGDTGADGGSPTFKLPTMTVLPAADIIRGGKEILVATSNDLTGSLLLDEALVGASLPPGWTSTLVGAGARATPSFHWLELATGTAVGASAAVTADDLHLHFDLAVDFSSVAPPETTTLGTMELASLELLPTLGGLASLRVMADARRPESIIVSFDWAPPVGAAIQVAQLVMPRPTLLKKTLRFVRYARTLWAFLGTRDARADADAYDELTLVGRLPDFVETDRVRARLVVRNGTSRRSVITRFTSYTVRGHATIAGRLMDDKRIIQGRQLIGKVPAATLPEAGLVDVILFGPFGRFIGHDSFKYTLPDRLSLGRGSAAPVETTSDPVLYDGRSRTRRRGGR